MRASSVGCVCQLRRRFSQLSQLRHLSLDAWERFSIDWEPGCLPNSLEELALKRVIGWAPDQDGGSLTAAIAAAASHATRLQSLTLFAVQAEEEWDEERPVPLQLDGLSGLAHLTELYLSTMGPMPDLAPLAALTALQWLKLSFEDDPGTPMGVQLQALTTLRELFFIGIHDPGLAELPCSIDALWHLPNMKAVDLVRSPIVHRLAEALDGSSIEILSLLPDSVVALGPCRLPSLHTLHIDMCFLPSIPLPALAAACMRSVATNIQPTPPLLYWEYGTPHMLAAVQRGLAGHQGPPWCEFVNPLSNPDEEYSSDDETSTSEEEGSEGEGSGSDGE